jgi:hypothetical protein
MVMAIGGCRGIGFQPVISLRKRRKHDRLEAYPTETSRPVAEIVSVPARPQFYFALRFAAVAFSPVSAASSRVLSVIVDSIR